MTDPYGTPVFTPPSFSVRFLLLTPYFVLCVARFVPFLAIVLSVLSYYQISILLNNENSWYRSMTWYIRYSCIRGRR
jgi:membrane-bound metal-dependent hydrolase YbcI (DUF457 family)